MTKIVLILLDVVLQKQLILSFIVLQHILVFLHHSKQQQQKCICYIIYQDHANTNADGKITEKLEYEKLQYERLC